MMNDPFCLILDLIPSQPPINSYMFPDIIAFLTLSVISPFSIMNALLASTEKSPEIGFAVCAPNMLVVIIPESISNLVVLI